MNKLINRYKTMGWNEVINDKENGECLLVKNGELCILNKRQRKIIRLSNKKEYSLDDFRGKQCDELNINIGKRSYKIYKYNEYVSVNPFYKVLNFIIVKHDRFYVLYDEIENISFYIVEDRLNIGSINRIIYVNNNIIIKFKDRKVEYKPYLIVYGLPNNILLKDKSK